MQVIKGPCKECQTGVKNKSGTAIYCSHNKAGSIFIDFHGETTWLTYSPMERRTFLVVVAGLAQIEPELKSFLEEDLPQSGAVN